MNLFLESLKILNCNIFNKINYFVKWFKTTFIRPFHIHSFIGFLLKQYYDGLLATSARGHIVVFKHKGEIVKVVEPC